MKLFSSILIVFGCIFLGLAMEASDHVSSANLSMYRGMAGSAMILVGAIALYIQTMRSNDPWL